MITENISALKIQKLSQKQFTNALANEALDNTSIYLTPVEQKDYALKSDLADKADLIDGKIPVEQLPSEAFESVTSWNDLEDKPFGETSLKIEWDGTPTDEFLSIEGINFYKVSDEYFKAESLIGSTVSLFSIEQNASLTETISLDSIVNLGENCFYISSPSIDGMASIIVTSAPGVVDGVEIPSSGIWFLLQPGIVYINCLETIQIEKIDKKFIPDDFGGAASWNDLKDKPFDETGFYVEYDLANPIYEFTVPVDEGYWGSSEIRYVKLAEPIECGIYGGYLGCNNDGVEELLVGGEELPVIISANGSESTIYVLNIKTDGEAVDMEEIYSIPPFVVPEAGLYFVDDSTIDEKGLLCYVKSEFHEINYLDKKFIDPDAISWENMSDKPFDATGIYFDYDLSKTTTSVFALMDDMPIRYAKFAEPLDDSLKHCYVGIEDNGLEEICLGEIKMPIITAPSGSEYMGYCLNIKTNGEVVDMEDFYGISPFTVPEAGLYAIDETSIGENGMFYYFRTEHYDIKYLDSKFISPEIGTWENMPDKPFEEKGVNITWNGSPTDTYVQVGQTVEWDGSDTGISVTVPASEDGTIPEGITFYKVAEPLSTLEECQVCYLFENGDIEEISINDISYERDDAGNIIASYEANDMWVWNIKQVAPMSIMGVEITFPEPGLYFISLTGTVRVAWLQDPVIANLGAPLTWCKIHEPLSSTLYGYEFNISAEGENTGIVFGDPEFDGASVIMLPSGSSCGGPYVINVIAADETFDFTDFLGSTITFTEPGLYICDMSVMGASFNYLKSPDYEIKQLDAKYLPSDSGVNSYNGVLTSVEGLTYESMVDLVALNYYKALSSGAPTTEEWSAKLGYGDLNNEEFIITLSPFSRGPIVSTNFDSIRIGLCNTYDSEGNMTIGAIIELNNVQEISLTGTYIIRCYRRADQSGWYSGLVENGIVREVVGDIDLPVTSKSVYEYIANLGINAEELADTKIKANTQVDWSVNDSSSMAYVKNRLVYDETPHESLSVSTKPVYSTTSSFGSTTFFGRSAEYRMLSGETIDNALEFARSIDSFYCNGITHELNYITVSGNAAVATVKSSRLNANSQDKIPYLIIKTGVNNSNSMDKSWTIDGITIPSGYAGVYTISSSEEAYPNRYVSRVSFNGRPHQLPVKYIPTDEEVTQGSTNLISSGAVHNALASIEDNLQFDSAPMLNSEKLVKSGGIATALDLKADKTTLDTKVSELSTEISKKASQSDVTTSVNNLTTEISKKASQSDVTTSVNNLTTEINKKADSSNVYSKSEIDGFLTGAFHYKGSVDTFASLPTSAETGDVYNVKTADIENNIKAGDNVVWCEAEGVGHWDALSGIVDLSAYWTSEEIQNELDEINKTKANLDDLAEVAKSNNYFDLENIPCSYVGVDQNIVCNGNYDTSTDNYFNVSNTYYFYYPKVAQYDNQKTIQDYIDGYVSITYAAKYDQSNPDDSAGTEMLTDLSYWTVLDNGIGIYMLNQSLCDSGFNNYPAVLIIPKDDLTYTVAGKILTFKSGIYGLVNKKPSGRPKYGYVKKVIFQKKYTLLDVNYLPQHVHNSSEISDLGSLLATKVDSDQNARLMTNTEGEKLAGIDEGANKYTLPAATTSSLGGVKVGANLSVSADGTISATSLDWDNIDNKPTTFAPNAHNHNDVYYTESEIDTKLTNKQDKSNLVTTLSSISTDSQYPSAKLLYTTKTNLETSINSKVDKVTGSRLMTNTEGTKLAGIDEGANKYTLPAATTSSLGGVKVGANLSVSADGTISATSLDWSNIKNKPTTFTPSTHNHDDLYYTESEINDLLSSIRASVDTKASQNALNTTNSNIQKLSDKIGTANGIASLDSTGKLNATQVPTNVQLTANMVTNIDSITLENQYPSAGLLKRTKESLTSSISSINTKLQNVEGIINEKQTKNLVTRIDENSTDEQYPSAKLLYSICSGYDELVESILTIIGDNTTV